MNSESGIASSRTWAVRLTSEPAALAACFLPGGTAASKPCQDRAVGRPVRRLLASDTGFPGRQFPAKAAQARVSAREGATLERAAGQTSGGACSGGACGETEDRRDPEGGAGTARPVVGIQRTCRFLAVNDVRLFHGLLSCFVQD